MVTRHLNEYSGDLPGNIVATIGPESLKGVPTSFDNEDFGGLGTFVSNTLIDTKTEVRE